MALVQSLVATGTPFSIPLVHALLQRLGREVALLAHLRQQLKPGGHRDRAEVLPDLDLFRIEREPGGSRRSTHRRVRITRRKSRLGNRLKILDGGDRFYGNSGRGALRSRAYSLRRLTGRYSS